MHKSIILKIKLLTLSLLLSSGLMAQEKLVKVSQSIKVNKDVAIDLNTSHCNVVFDTWNKGEVQIEAFIEGDGASQEELQEALKNWKVEVDGTQTDVSIATSGNHLKTWVYKTDKDEDVVTIVLDELKHELADLPNIIMKSFDVDINIPEAPEAPKAPELPELPEGIGTMNFDYEAYKKDGEKYIEKYTEQFESKFGKDFERKMEIWGESFGRHMEEWGKKIEKNFNSEEFEEKMEAWGERFAEQIEKEVEKSEARAERAEAHQERVEAHKERIEVQKQRMKERLEQAKNKAKLEKKRRIKIEQYIGDDSKSKIKKTIKIKLPKEARIKVDVKHGELEFASSVNDLEADLSHTKFTAYGINGNRTSINASYSPINVSNWNLGELNLNYVDKAQLGNVKRLVLNSNASNVEINKLTDNAMINGSIGDFKIENIDDSFNNLSIILQNSDAVISLPKVNYNLQYSGSRTRFSHPDMTNDEESSTFSKNASGTNKTIVVNAKYSNVIMQ